MKKFGLKKDKYADEAEDASRSKLFGSKSKSRSPVPPSANPYAAPQAPPPGGNPYASSNPYANAPGGSKDPYTNPYAQSSQSSFGTRASVATAGSAPPAYDGGGYGGLPNESQRREKSPVPPGGYGGYGSRDKSPTSGYGSGGGYGESNPYGGGGYGGYGGGGYGNDNPYGSTGGEDNSKLRPGGYGGLGRTKSNDSGTTEAGRQALFGGARERYEKKQADQPSGYGLPPEQDPARGGDSTWNGASALGEGGQGYGAYPDRQLTAEEEEEQDVQATKDQIRFIKQQDVASTRNALRIAAQAEETGRETLARLGAQGDRIHNTEKNLDLSASQNRLAEEKAKELKHLNRSMWAVKVDNPFTKKARERERDDAILEKHLYEKEQRESTRRAAFTTEQRHQDNDRKLRAPGASSKSRNLAERSKYQFEADSEDEQMEDEIDGNLDALAGAAKRLNLLSRAMGSEVEEQNKHIDRIVDKADDVDIKLAMNRARLDRIR